MSTFFEWDDSKLGLAVPSMDAEHRHLVSLMNTLHGLHEAKAPRAAVGQALGALAAYTARHFADEEAYMARIGFAGLATHRLVHKTLLARVQEFATDFGRTGTLTDAFFAFLKMWLKAHICGIDSKYAEASRAA